MKLEAAVETIYWGVASGGGGQGAQGAASEGAASPGETRPELGFHPLSPGPSQAWGS